MEQSNGVVLEYLYRFYYSSQMRTTPNCNLDRSYDYCLQRYSWYEYQMW